jgi:hypothetical protein
MSFETLKIKALDGYTIMGPRYSGQEVSDVPTLRVLQVFCRVSTVTSRKP